MLANVPLVLSSLREACGMPSSAVEACAICRALPDRLVRLHDPPIEAAKLVPFIAERSGDARGGFFGGPEDLPMFVRDGQVRRCPTCGRMYLCEHEREYMDSRSPYEPVDPPEDTYTYTRVDAEQLFRSPWFVTMRMDLDGRFTRDRGEFWVLPQPYFRRHAFARFQYAGGTQTLVLPDEEAVLVADLATLSRVIAADPPLLDDEVGYARFVDRATTEYGYQYLEVAAFDDIPWRADLDDAARARIEDLRGASPVAPMRVTRAPEAVVIERWIVAHRKLICRIMTVRPTGDVTREDAIVGEDLPTHLGTRWQFNHDKRRLEPVA